MAALFRVIPVCRAVAIEGLILTVVAVISSFGADPGRTAPALDPEDISHRQVLDELMSSLFLKKGDSWFTQSVRDASPIPYEFKALILSGPTSLVVTEADKQDSIDRRLSFGFSVSAYRKFDKTSGWQPWVKGKPTLLTGIILNRVDGLWVIASSPKDSFSLK